MLDRIPFLEKELFLLRLLVRPGDVCVDIGAAGGAHLVAMARGVGRDGTVLAIEPRPASARLLRGGIRTLGLGGRVRVRQVATSDDVGEVTLRIPIVPTRAHVPGTSTDPATAAFARLPHRRIVVPTTPLDALLTDEGIDRVDVVKCDVEGAELLALAGAEHVLQDLRPVWIIEADDLHQRRFDATAQDVLDAVTRHGYGVHRFRRGALEPVTQATADEDDYVFIPDEREVAVPRRLDLASVTPSIPRSTASMR
jgi:FkbM family methyltransferase